MEIKKAALVGFGALGGTYAGKLFKGMNDGFSVIAGGSRGERIRKNGVMVNGEKLTPDVVEPERRDYKADLIIFAVKNYQLEQAIEDAKNAVSDETILLPILNGVWAHDRIQEIFPKNTVLYGLSTADAERTERGIECSYEGELNFGEADNAIMSEKVKAVKELFDKCGIISEAKEDMLRAVWYKFMINVSVNQLSAITGAGYGAFLNVPELNRAMREVKTEVITLANAMNIKITEEDAANHEKGLVNSDPNGQTSMLQDINAKRKTEVDYFARTVIKLGKKYGVPTPWNDRMYLIIKTMESLYGVK